jgi:hypothetical protein
LERAGAGFSCETTKAQLDWAQKYGVSADAQCGRIGPLWLMMSRADAEKLLGSPVDKKTIEGKDYFVYSLQGDASGQMTTYAVLSYDTAGSASTLQVTGEPWSGAWSFADIKLGDSDKVVIDRVGEAHGVSPSDEADTVVWNYLPWTFSFEVKNRRVSSMRVAVQ